VGEIAAGPPPARMKEQMLGQPPRHGEAAGKGLAQSAAVEGAYERREEEIGDGAVVPVTRVGGQHEISLVVPHWTGETLEPVLGHGRHVGLEQDDRACAETPRRLKRELQREASPRHAVEWDGGELADGRLVTS